MTHDNYIFYAMKHYDNPNCSGMAEFYEDLNRIKYLKKLITRYIQSGELQERLILNHLIILSNMFGPEALVKMLFLKMTIQQMALIKPFLVLMDICPQVVYDVGKDGNKIYTDDIEMNQTVINQLRKI